MIVSLLSGCRQLEEKIDSVSSRVDQIENTRIKTISEQLKSIETSLPKLEQTDKELRGYIGSLETTADNLRKSITESESKIAELENELGRAIEDAKMSDGALKSDLEQQISTAKSDVLASSPRRSRPLRRDSARLSRPWSSSRRGTLNWKRKSPT